MKLVHTFYNINDNKAHEFINHICFMLSCLCAKNIGYNIDLHCDKKTAELYSIAPYDNIYADLIDLDMPKGIYAKSKFDIMKNEPFGDIHIDGDVFLLRETVKPFLEFDEYDIIVQNKETHKNVGCHLWNESSYLLSKCKYPEYAKKKCDAMYNCGVIGFNNQELKNIYFNMYYSMLEQYRKNSVDGVGIPDIIIEQQFLCDLCEKYNYKVKFVLDEKNPKEISKKIGYSHLIGPSKYTYYKNVIKLIQKMDKGIYEELKKIYKNII